MRIALKHKLQQLSSTSDGVRVGDFDKLVAATRVDLCTVLIVLEIRI